MNNKESKTYKDTYHFGTGYYPMDEDSLPSIESEPDINTTIKKNPYRSNVEIEGDEVVMQPDMSALFKAKGKKHSGGGMDVFLKPESFVFSNDKSLALDKKDLDMFELGGKWKGKQSNKQYTPSEVLKKNIDVEHYNTLTNNLEDLKKDDLAKKSSLLMLEKYFKTLGNIAFVQEAKKGFPQGVPAFAQGTAPVYDTETKDDINEQKQYAKYGGNILPIAQAGKSMPPKDAKPGEWVQDFHGKWHKLSGVFPQQETGTGVWDGKPNKFISRFISTPYTYNQQLPADLANIIYGKKQQAAPVNTTSDKVHPNNADVQTQTGKDVNWDFTPWQKLSMGYDAYKYASAKRYMPFRSRFNPSYVEPALLNPEQTIGDLKGAAYQQSQAANTLSPILRNAQQAGIYGQLLNQIPQVRSQYDNQNIGILNQTRQYNNQVRNTAQGVNMKNDADYYQQSVVGQQNFDNMKGFLSDRLMNNIQGNVQDNQTLALQLLSQGPNPAYSYDFKTGRYTRNTQNINNIPGAPGEGLYEDIIKGLKNLPDSDPKKWEIYEKILRQRNIIPYLTQQKKKGGTIRNPYKY